MVSQYIEDTYGPNVTRILCEGSRIITGRIPAQVRAQLRAAVKDGVLGHLKKDGLKPEIFYHPDHKLSAKERQAREAAYAIECIAKVVAVKPVEQQIEEAIASLKSA